jgi:CheY-like chemotaxis protein
VQAFWADAALRAERIELALQALALTRGEEAREYVEELSSQAHSVHGAAATVSLGAVANLARVVERAVEHWDPDDSVTQDDVAAAARALHERLRALASTDFGAGEALAKERPSAVEGALVLHIEDNLSNLKLVERILDRRPEVSLAEARGGKEGLELAAKLQPDLVLLDLRLPDVTGEEVLRLLREDEATVTIPVVVVSAEARPAETDRLLAAGADDFLVKPIDVNTLLGVVDRILARAKR